MGVHPMHMVYVLCGVSVALCVVAPVDLLVCVVGLLTSAMEYLVSLPVSWSHTPYHPNTPYTCISPLSGPAGCMHTVWCDLCVHLLCVATWSCVAILSCDLQSHVGVAMFTVRIGTFHFCISQGTTSNTCLQLVGSRSTSWTALDPGG